MDKVLEMFQEEIGMPFPQGLLPVTPMQPLAGFPNNEFILGSKIAVVRAYLDQGSITDFLNNAPDGYLLMGFWGHGMNSHAFYYCLADSWRRLYFRLPYGGVYMDNAEMAEHMRGFLSGYIAYEEAIRDTTRSLVAVESMGFGNYRVEGKDGRIAECSESLFEHPDFGIRLSLRS